MIVQKKGSSKTEEAHQDDENGLDDAKTFSMTVFNSAKEEDGHSQKERSSLEDIIELKEEEEGEGQDVISSKDAQSSVMDESIILRKSLRKGEGGMYFEEYLV